MSRRHVDWTNLPEELLGIISHCLNSPFYCTRFRSVCNTWRSSSPKYLSLRHPLPFNLPILSTEYTTATKTTSIFALSKCTILLISLSTETQNPNSNLQNPNPFLQNPNLWLVQITQDPHGQTQFFHPLTHSLLKPTNSPQLVDLNNLPVLDLGNGVTVEDTLHFTKMLLLWLSPQKDDFALLTIYISGWLVLFRSSAPNWILYSRFISKPYDDICIHNGSFYAIDREGWTVKVGLDWSFKEFADTIIFGDKSYLISSRGDLLLLEKFLYRDNQGLSFDIYRLVENDCSWQQVESIGDTILFLGKDCWFSAEAWELGLGNLRDSVVFNDDDKPGEPKDDWRVFCFSDKTVTPFSHYPMLSKVFCPPPNWVGFH